MRCFLEQDAVLKNWTYHDTALPCVRDNKSIDNVRGDFVWVLGDRVVILEVDEQVHKFNSPECERRREQELQEGVPRNKFLVLLRFNPASVQTLLFEALHTLGEKLKEAFTTPDVVNAVDGILRFYVGYPRKRIRELSAAWETAQKARLVELEALPAGPSAVSHKSVQTDPTESAEQTGSTDAPLQQWWLWVLFDCPDVWETWRGRPVAVHTFYNLCCYYHELCALAEPAQKSVQEYLTKTLNQTPEIRLSYFATEVGYSVGLQKFVFHGRGSTRTPKDQSPLLQRALSFTFGTQA